jgi:hypothetical protein
MRILTREHLVDVHCIGEEWLHSVADQLPLSYDLEAVSLLNGILTISQVGYQVRKQAWRDCIFVVAGLTFLPNSVALERFA